VEACEWVCAFVDWYNHHHHHSGIKFVTPHQRHSGAAKAICQQRAEAYEAARKAKALELYHTLLESAGIRVDQQANRRA
jgi:hypothetical protein